MSAALPWLERVAGCVLGAAIGDALGYPVEGARCGLAALPPEWVRDVERSPELLALAGRLAGAR